MKVKIGSMWFDSGEQPIMLLLSDDDKRNIGTMPDDNFKYCSYPDIPLWTDNNFEQIKVWMETTHTGIAAPERGVTGMQPEDYAGDFKDVQP